MSTITIDPTDLGNLRVDLPELVRQLNAAFGPTLVAAMSGSRDSKAPIRWAKPGATMRPEFERNLRFAHRILTAIAEAEDVHVARAWFIGSNPMLDEDSPINAIRENRHRQVSAAATHFVSGGFSA